MREFVVRVSVGDMAQESRLRADKLTTDPNGVTFWVRDEAVAYFPVATLLAVIDTGCLVTRTL